MRYICSEEQVVWKKQTIGEIEEQILKDSVNKGWLEEIRDDGVWIHEGDLTLDFLDLDWAKDADVQEPSVIMIKGNLLVKGNVINKIEDGAIGLMVFGDLQANHMAVSGQEIYVSGDIKIAGLFCGCYNHGSTVVTGNLEALVLLNDDYSFAVGGEQKCACIYEEGDIYIQAGGIVPSLQDLLVKEAFFFDLYDVAFHFTGLVEILEQGKSPLKNINAVLNNNQVIDEERAIQYAEAYSRRGIAYYYKEQYDEAIADYTQAIILNPQDEDTYCNRGTAYNDKKQYDQAIADYTQAIAINPQCDDAYYNRGIVYSNKEQNDQAIADYTKAITINQQHERAYHNRGIIYNEQGRYDQAIADYTQAIDVDLQFEAAYCNRGISHQNKGHNDQAIADYTQAITIDSEFALAYQKRGIAHQNKGHNDQAIANYTQAIAINPQFALAYRNRSLAYKNKGQHDLALVDYNKAIELDPELDK